MTRIEAVVLDMAGTTVIDDGLVLRAFERAWDRHADATVTRESAIAHIIDTMGQSKIEVFRGLVSEDDAHALNALFESALNEVVAEGGIRAIPGAEDVIRALQAEGRAVVLTTGFARVTADAVLAALGWEQLPDAVFTPAEAGRGRPAPDMVLRAALFAEVSCMAAVAVVGDTESDARTGVNAGAGLVVGVRTGGVDDALLLAAGADEVLDSVGGLPALLARKEL